jgi:uncharacterized membrane protein HdeD (DUF308 family)
MLASYKFIMNRTQIWYCQLCFRTLKFQAPLYVDMKAEHVADIHPPRWTRALQIGIGAIAIGLSISSIIYPIFAVMATFTAAAIILLLFGIEHVVAGIFLYKQSRFAHIGLGILVIILSSIVMAYPLATAAFVVLLAAIALLFSGIVSIIAGLVIGIALLVYGIRLVVTGISERKGEEAVRSTLSS